MKSLCASVRIVEACSDRKNQHALCMGAESQLLVERHSKEPRIADASAARQRRTRTEIHLTTCDESDTFKRIQLRDAEAVLRLDERDIE